MAGLTTIEPSGRELKATQEESTTSAGDPAKMESKLLVSEDHTVQVQVDPQPIQVLPESASTPSCGCLVARASVLYLLWAFFGFLSGFHLFGLMCCPPPASGSRKFVCGQLASHFGALVVFGMGGGICRSRGADDCPGGEEMSQSCLWYHQDATYQFFYITHFMGLAWLIVQWVADGLSLWGWSGDGLRESAGLVSPMNAFGIYAGGGEAPAAARLRWHYAAVVSCWALLSILIWSVKWSADTPGGGDLTVSDLGSILFPVMLVWLIGSCVTLRCLVGREQNTQA